MADYENVDDEDDQKRDDDEDHEDEYGKDAVAAGDDDISDIDDGNEWYFDNKTQQSPVKGNSLIEGAEYRPVNNSWEKLAAKIVLPLFQKK